MYASSDWILAPPALGSDGTIYITTTALCAITNSGSVASNKWTFAVSASGPPAVGADGTIYIGSTDGNLYAVKPDGSRRWAYDTGGGGGCPAIGTDGTVYYNGYGSLYAVTAQGGRKWTADVGDAGNWKSPFIDSRGTIYIASWARTTLYAFNPDGTQKWVAPLQSRPGDSGAVGADGTIYIAAGPLYAFTPEGTNLWATEGALLDGSPIIASDGTLCLSGTGSHILYAFSPAGIQAWNALGAPSGLGSTIAGTDGDGHLYYSVSNGLWALDATGRVQWTVTQSGDPGPGNFFAMTSPVVGRDGTIYAALGNTLYAIASGTNGPAASPWPMYRQNVRHTGKVERPALNQPQKRSDANFQFQLYPQQVGFAYTIETSTNLSAWTSMTSFVANSFPTTVVDLAATNYPLRFYRAVSSP